MGQPTMHLGHVHGKHVPMRKALRCSACVSCPQARRGAKPEFCSGSAQTPPSRPHSCSEGSLSAALSGHCRKWWRRSCSDAFTDFTTSRRQADATRAAPGLLQPWLPVSDTPDFAATPQAFDAEGRNTYRPQGQQVRLPSQPCTCYHQTKRHPAPDVTCHAAAHAMCRMQFVAEVEGGSVTGILGTVFDATGSELTVTLATASEV